MPQRGDIVVERLTGKRAIVIRVTSAEEATCRFADGRLADRFTFEFEPPLLPLGSLLAFFLSGFLNRFRLSASGSAPGAPQLPFVRQPNPT